MTTVVNGDYGNVWNWADNTMQKNLELVGDYTKSLGLHNLGAMIGYSYHCLLYTSLFITTDTLFHMDKVDIISHHTRSVIACIQKMFG